MTAEGAESDAPASVETTATTAAESEAERSRGRALRSLMEVSSRLMSLSAMASDGKSAAELAASSAWVSAFACQLAGVPVELARSPTGERLLVSVELDPRFEKDVDAHVYLPSEALRIEQLGAASAPAAFGLGLVGLARKVVEDAIARLPAACEPDRRHRQAEMNLATRLGHALVAYESEICPPEPPSVSAHGVPPEE